jgi:hypothetical protein
LYSYGVPLEGTNVGKNKEISQRQRLPLLKRLKVHLKKEDWSLKENFYFFLLFLSRTWSLNKLFELHVYPA